jgi:hypothetical protein
MGQNARQVMGQNARQVMGQKARQVMGQNAHQVMGQDTRQVMGQDTRQVMGQHDHHVARAKLLPNDDQVMEQDSYLISIYQYVYLLSVEALTVHDGDERVTVGEENRAPAGHRPKTPAADVCHLPASVLQRALCRLWSLFRWT